MAQNQKMSIQVKSICLILSIVLFFFYTMMDRNSIFIVGTLTAIPGIIGLLKTRCLSLQLFTFVVLISSLINIIATSYGIGGSIVFFICCGITYASLKNLKLFFLTSVIICIGLLIFLYHEMFTLGVVNGDIFIDYGLSKNYPGSLLVIFNCLWAIWKHSYYRRMPLCLPILSTIMCFFLDGRSSLVCIVLITLFCFIVRGKNLTIFMGVITIILIAYYWTDLQGYYELTSLASKGTETSRTEIWKSYFDHIDFISLIFGLDTQHIPIISSYGGNPHNSFLSFHRRMGLLSICALIAVIVYAIYILIRNKRFIYLTFLIILLIRMFFDGMLVTGEDFFILTIIFIPIVYNYKEFNIKEQLKNKDNSWFGKTWGKIAFIL